MHRPAGGPPPEVQAADGTRYPRVGSAVLAPCAEPDSVGPRLIALIDLASESQH
ncbi:hypothetical protein ACGF07_04480 [Kitasatospora sp. NPDC048194]|uniref:hypothetical protein n=1 Tax=Kitasatospora sp. NPDC048194 TaxID=3364045 RepID=UPI0037101D69